MVFSKLAEIFGRNSTKQQDKDLLKWQLQVREPIRSFSDIKIGDHLVRKKSVFGKALYYHHFLCIGSEGEGRPTIIHYFNPAESASHQLFETWSFGSGSALGKVATIQEVTLPHKYFIGSESELQSEGAEVERVVWPKELRRYSIDEVIQRARKRKDEDLYDPGENNCESYVMWCLCNSNISLQATPPVLTLTEIISGTGTTIFHGAAQIPRVTTKLIEKLVQRIPLLETGFEGLKGLRAGLGVLGIALWEIGYVAYKIYKAKQIWNKGQLITSREEFIKKIIEILRLAMFRSSFSVAGMFFGGVVIPIPVLGEIVGLLLGTVIGHLVGKT